MYNNKTIPNYLIDIPYAIVDSGMNIFFGNTPFLALLGNHARRSAFYLFNDDDIERIQCIFDTAFVDTEKVFFTNIYFEQDYSKPIPAYVSIIPFTEKLPQAIDFEMIGDVLFEVIIFTLNNIKHKLASFYYNMHKQHLLLSLKYTLSFEYKPLTNRFNIYWVSNQQNIYFFKGTLDEFYNDSIAQNAVPKEDLNTFNDFINSIKNNASIFKYKFQTTYFSKLALAETYWVTGNTMADINGQNIVVGILSLYNEVTKNIQDYMLEEMFLDPLTNILAKKHITEYAEEIISKHPGCNVCVCIIDIDNFKSVNDTFGHSFGDDVLRASAQVISDSAGSKGIPGRIGGDEFMLILYDIKDELELRNILRTIRYGLSWLFPEQLNQLQFGCSVGVSVYPKDADNYNDLFHIADKCTYIAKAKGKRRYIIYKKELHGEYDPNEKTLILKNSKIEHTDNSLLIGNYLSSLYKKGNDGITDLLKNIATLLNFDRIQIFTGKDLLEYKSFITKPESIRTVYQADYAFLPDYKELYLQQHLFILPNVYNLEYSHHEIFETFLANNTMSSYQYIFQNDNGDIIALISYDFCFKENSLLSDTISDYILIVSSAIEYLLTP